MLPRRNNEVVCITGPRGTVLNVKRLKEGSYFARVRGTALARRGDENQIQADLEHFLVHGQLPEKESERTIPGPGDRVRFAPTRDALEGYTKHPQLGETGSVIQVPFGRRKTHYVPGPSGGTLYVKWSRSVIGVSMVDVERA